MKVKYWLLFVMLVLAMGLCGCNGTDTPTPIASVTPVPTASVTPVPTASATPTPGPSLNLLIEVEGGVSLKRKDWTSYVTTTFGIEVRRGDLVRPEEGGEIKILCADLSLHSAAREGGIPCKVETPVLQYGERRVLTPRNPTKTIPYILHPRNTGVLDAHPMLRWNDTGASGYRVAVVEEGKEIWYESGITSTEMRYPDNATELQPGVDYLLVVQDEDSERHSGEDPVKGLGFQVLSEEERSEVKVQREKILALQLSDPAARDFVLAVYYNGLGLRGEALATLDDTSLDAPAVQLMIGDLLLSMILSQDAANAYAEGLDRAKVLGDVESQAEAYVGIWRAGGGEDCFCTALELYKQLGDESIVTKLKEDRFAPDC